MSTAGFLKSFKMVRAAGSLVPPDPSGQDALPTAGPSNRAAHREWDVTPNRASASVRTVTTDTTQTKTERSCRMCEFRAGWPMAHSIRAAPSSPSAKPPPSLGGREAEREAGDEGAVSRTDSDHPSLPVSPPRGLTSLSHGNLKTKTVSAHLPPLM